LLQLAHESGLRERIDAMFRDDKINVSENRAALRVALRASRGTSILDKMADFADRLRGGRRQAHPGS